MGNRQTIKVSDSEGARFVAAESPLQLFAACRTPSVRGLQLVKEYLAHTKVLRRRGTYRLPPIELIPKESLSEVVGLASASPETSIVLACGYRTSEIRSILAQRGKSVTVGIISYPPTSAERYHKPTSSLFEERTITRVQSLKEGVRKAVLRLVSRQLGELRRIKEMNEFEPYFSLRCRVWSEMNYISPDSGLDEDGWEIDRFDRFALPIGFFSRTGELAACARLVQQYGRESAEHVKSISALLARGGHENAVHAFAYSGTAEQPFDILCEFRGFREYFKTFIRERVALAEVSRIIVDSKYRGYGLSEVLVDSLVSLAKVHGIDVLMLACRCSLSPLYEKCGFVPVPNLISDKFLSIPEKSIVMERVVRRRSD